MKIRTFIFLSVLSVLYQPVFAQWQQVYQIPLPIDPLTPYNGAIQFKHNIIYFGSEKTLYMSKDTGITWIARPIFGTGTYMSILDLDFLTDSIGVVCGTSGGAYMTFDQGASWKRISTFTNGFSINFIASVNKIMMDAHFSSDGGNSWTQTMPPELVNCVRFDNKTGLLYTLGTNFGNIYISRDSGLSWNKTSGKFDGDSWSFAIDSCENNSIYIANEDCVAPTNGLGEVFISSNSGNSWTSHFAAPICHISGSISIGRRAIYCPTQSKGIYRSIDHGITWLPIGGPSSPHDTRLIAAINDNIIIAADDQDRVWRTTNSGGVPIPPPLSMPFIRSPVFKPVSSCNQTFDSIIVFPRQDCGSNTTITNISLEGKDSALFSVSFPPVPLILSSDTGLKSMVLFTPKGNIDNDTSFIHIHGFYWASSDSIAFDTVITIIGKSLPVAPILFADKSNITFDTLSTCLPPRDTIVTFTNKGCDTLKIISGPGALIPEFTLISTLNLPFTLPPDSSLELIFRFKPSSKNHFYTTATFTAEQQTLTRDVIITLSGDGGRGIGALSYVPKQFNFQSLSICAHDSSGGYITNVGCDSISVDPFQIFGDADYRVSGVGFLVSEKPGDTIRYMVYLDPAQKGLRQGFLVLTSGDKINSHNDTVHFTVTVTDGTRILYSALSAANFGSIPVCDERDTMVTLRNTGCDTLVISSANGLGLGFGSDTKFPISILPGKDTAIHIFTLLDTVGGKLSTAAILTFNSNSDNTLSPITLSRTFIQSTHRDLGLYLDGSAKSGGDLSIVTYDIKELSGKTFSGAGIPKITFDLNYNTDLLDFQQSQSSNVTSSDGKSFTITGSPNIQANTNGILASIGFRVYLTKDSVTKITLVNVKIDTSGVSLPCSTLSLSDSGSATFDYNYLCGERSISGFMNGQRPLKIVSIHPNPSQDEIELDLQSTGRQDALIEIFDALGVKVFSDSRSIAPGSNSIHLDTKSLSAGMYLVRIGNTSQSFVKVK